jgi:molecular chaperone GrpE
MPAEEEPAEASLISEPVVEAAPGEAAAVEGVSPEQAEIAALKDRHARLLADFDNYRKRQLREREDWGKRANEALLEDFLPVVDNLELALGKADPSDPFAAGVKMVYGQFIAALEKHGVTPLDAKGQPFNPDWHEALSQMPSDTVPENEVIEQFRRGWCIGGRLMRPAQVIVSSGAAEAPEGK